MYINWYTSTFKCFAKGVSILNIILTINDNYNQWQDSNNDADINFFWTGELQFLLMIRFLQLWRVRIDFLFLVHLFYAKWHTNFCTATCSHSNFIHWRSNHESLLVIQFTITSIFSTVKALFWPTWCPSNVALVQLTLCLWLVIQFVSCKILLPAPKRGLLLIPSEKLK